MQRISETERELVEVADGVHLADLAAGESACMKYWRVEAGGTLPGHSHQNEQIGYVIRGRLTAVLDGDEVTLEPGDSYAFRSGEYHGAENRGDDPAVGIGILSPPRSSPEWGTRLPASPGPERSSSDADD